jgi:BioD-like phosphotransacetylase family protein
MRALLVASLEPHAGKTGVAAALTQRLAYAGSRAVAVRLGAEVDRRAAADAAFFATLPGARGRGGRPLAPPATSEIAEIAGEGAAIVEPQDGADVPMLAQSLDAAVVLVQRGLPDENATVALQNLALLLGERFLGVVLTALAPGAERSAEATMEDAALPLLAALPEDRLLYAPTVAEIADALEAELLLGEESEEQVIEELMIGPISSDPGQAYYARRGNKAVITRSDKTDSQLAAMQTNTDCLILTGGLSPSPYTLDRASNEEVAVMLTRRDTRGAVQRLEQIFEESRFGSERKLERMAELLKQRLDWQPIGQALAPQGS